MKKLIELSNKIKDEKLRKMVVDFLKDLKLSNKHFKKYPKMNIKEGGAMFTVGASTVRRDVLNHTLSVVELCEKTADILEKIVNLELNRDNLIAAAILHDVMKLFEWKRGETGLEHSGIMLDHGTLGVAELYHRGFPEEIVHIVAAHFGETGPTPPRTFEALIFYHLDNMMSLVEFRLASVEEQQHQIQLLLLNDEIVKKLQSENGGEIPGPKKTTARSKKEKKSK